MTIFEDSGDLEALKTVENELCLLRITFLPQRKRILGILILPLHTLSEME